MQKPASISDQIAFSLSQELGFDCHAFRGPPPSSYSFKKYGAGVCSPTLCGRAGGPNPCGEVPAGHYELFIEIIDSTVVINKVLKFDLNDPECFDKIKAEFVDLRSLAQKIENLQQGYPAEGIYLSLWT